jgi:NADH dehydrogenase
VGDAAAMKGPAGAPVPGIAPAAKQAGRHAARVIGARVAGRTTPGPFHYRHAGDLATIGRSAAVVRFDGFHLTGWLGWVFWGLAHIYFLIGLRNRVAVALDWSWSWLTRQRHVRLIIG